MKPFHITALIGFTASGTGSLGIVSGPLFVLPYSTAKVVELAAVALAVLGIVASSTAIYLGWRDGHRFTDYKRTWTATCLGIALPLLY